MASLKQLRQRLKATSSVVKVTKVVQLISANKFRKAKELAAASKSFYNTNVSHMKSVLPIVDSMEELQRGRLSDLSKSVLGALGDSNSNNRMILLITSDKSLCGNLNSAVVKKLAVEVEKYLKEEPNKKIHICYIGKQAKSLISNYLSNYLDKISLVNLDGFYEEKMVTARLEEFVSLVLSKAKELGANNIEFFYNDFVATLIQVPVKISFSDIILEQDDNSDIYIDVDKVHLLDSVIRSYVFSLFSNALKQHMASENALRMTSMDNATKNGNELKDRLQLSYNKIRQSKITSDLIDIVNGADFN